MIIQRWLFSTNAKDISVLYFILALFSGIVGTAMSVIIRLELAGPGPQHLAGNNQVFNVLVVGHAVAMIFFMVMPALIGAYGKHIYNNLLFIDLNNNINNLSLIYLLLRVSDNLSIFLSSQKYPDSRR